MIKPPHADVRRNVFAPRSDRLQLLYAISDDGGEPVTLANLGLDSQPTAMSAGRIRYVTGGVETDAVAAARTALWAGDAAPDGTMLAFNDGVYVDHYVNMHVASGALDLPRGTVLLRVQLDDTDTGAVVPLLSAGASDVYGGLKLFRRGGGATNRQKLRVDMWDSGAGSVQLDTGAVVDGSLSWHTVILTWGEQGVKLYVDTLASEVSDAHTDKLALANTETLRAMASVGEPPTNFANYPLGAVAMWDVQLTEGEIAELLADPNLTMRPEPSSGFALKNNPVMTRPTRDYDTPDTCTLLFNGVSGALTSGTSYLRIKYRRESVGGAWTTSSSVSKTNSATAGETYQSLQLTLSSLLDDELYEWIAEWSDDDVTWYPLPGGLGRWRTPPDVRATWKFIFWSDDHRAQDSMDGAATDDECGLESTERKPYANWRAAKDAYERHRVTAGGAPVFAIHGGDGVYTEQEVVADDLGDLDAAKFERIAAWCAAQNLWLKTHPVFFVLGNHEGESGFEQNADTDVKVALQKQCTIARQRCLPNPINTTYAEGGENEGDETAAGGNDWIPARTDADADATVFDEYSPGRDYRDDFVYDTLGGGGSYAENKSPLGNYFAWTHADLLCIVLDPLRYANPGGRAENDSAADTIGAAGGTGGGHERPDRPWRLGPTQKAWLQTVLAGSSATHIIICAHNLPVGEVIGGGGSSDPGYSYGRGSGVRIPTASDGGAADAAWLIGMCQRYGVKAIVKGHDHKFCVVNYGGVTVITAPSVSATSHLSATANKNGWHWEAIANSFGTAESLGRLDYDGDAMPADRMDAMFNVLGYLVFTVTPTTLSVTLRQTSGTLQTDHETPNHHERWVGPVYTADGSSQIDLTAPKGDQAHNDVADFDTVAGETPNQVVAVVKVSDLSVGVPASEWWVAGHHPTNRYSSPLGNEPADEPHSSAVIQAVGVAASDVVVLAVPRNVYTKALATPSAASGAPRRFGKGVLLT